MPEGADQSSGRGPFDDERAVRFTPEQERQFEADTARARSRMLFRRGLLGIAFYLAYLGIDWLLTPDIFWLSFIMRVVVVTPIALALLLVVRSNPPMVVREGLMGFLVVFSSLVTLILVTASTSPLRDHHHHGFILLALFVVAVLRLRFPYAVITCLALFSVEAMTLALAPEPDSARSATDMIMFIAASALCLIAAESIDRNMRAIYLYQRRQSLRTASLEDLSRHDPLTGLGNRRALDDALTALAGQQVDGDVAVIVADIDHFKSYNDTLGHPAGDVCLKRVAALISAELRGDDDRAIRFGGEEFLVLLPDTDLATAQIIAERMRRNIFDAGIPHPGRRTGVVTASFGVASSPAGLGGDELIAAADAALYAAKNAGRNQVWPLPPALARAPQSRTA